MIVEIRSPNMELDQGLREWTQRRLGFALGRFADGVGRIPLSVRDGSVSHRRIDMECCFVEARALRRKLASEGLRIGGVP